LIWIIPKCHAAAKNHLGKQENTMLEINPEKVRQVIVEARMFDAKEEVTDPDSGSNAGDDGMIDILEDNADDATGQELAEFIRSLDDDEQAELVALAWVGRGTYDASQFAEAVTEAARVHNRRTAEYLLSLPMLGDYLEEGLNAVEELENDSEDAS
jgi:DNA-binding PucR family transcriptional regulator